MDENQMPMSSPEWRYAIYARRSTEDAEKMVRSIPEQIKDCQQLADEQGLNVVEVIQETRSAKVPNKRPEFKRMMQDVSDNRIQGIISFHPDRLARNMIEAGRIIHMLDTNKLRDLRFKSHQFSNDANGKMLLGMLFVFAKHYSDNLKYKVDWGNQNNLDVGKSNGAPKHGYIRDDEGIYRKDAKNFELVQQAWLIRADGNTEQACANYLNYNGYSRYIKKQKQYVDRKLHKSNLGRMFGDTFYFGLLNQAGNLVDMRTAPIPFEPMITEEIFYKVQQHARIKTRGPGKKREIFLPLRGLVYCGICNYGKYVSVGRPRDKYGVNRLFYTCKNKDCPRNPKSLRGKKVFDSLAAIIKAKIDTIPITAYETYLKDVKAASGSQKVRIREDLSRMQAVLKGHNSRLDTHTASLGKLTNAKAIDALNKQIDALSADIVELEGRISEARRKLAKSELPSLSPELFEQRIKRTAAKFRKADKFQKDMIIQEMFSKLYIDNEKVATYLWKEPYLSLVEATEVAHGRGDRT